MAWADWAHLCYRLAQLANLYLWLVDLGHELANHMADLRLLLRHLVSELSNLSL